MSSLFICFRNGSTAHGTIHTSQFRGTVELDESLLRNFANNERCPPILRAAGNRVISATDLQEAACQMVEIIVAKLNMVVDRDPYKARNALRDVEWRMRVKLHSIATTLNNLVDRKDFDGALDYMESLSKTIKDDKVRETHTLCKKIQQEMPYVTLALVLDIVGKAGHAAEWI